MPRSGRLPGKHPHHIILPTTHRAYQPGNKHKPRNPGAQFDPTKFSWLGPTTTETNVCVAYKTAAVKTVFDLQQKELLVGDNGAGTGTGNYPKALSQLLGLKFKIVRG